MLNWQLRYWANNDHQRQIETWLDSLSKKQIKSIAKELTLLQRCGNTLCMPHSRSLGEGLFELRERNFGYRIYYGFLPNCVIVLLHAGKKSTRQRDIITARKRFAALKVKTNGLDNEN